MQGLAEILERARDAPDVRPEPERRDSWEGIAAQYEETKAPSPMGREAERLDLEAAESARRAEALREAADAMLVERVESGLRPDRAAVPAAASGAG